MPGMIPEEVVHYSFNGIMEAVKREKQALPEGWVEKKNENNISPSFPEEEEEEERWQSCLRSVVLPSPGLIPWHAT